MTLLSATQTYQQAVALEQQGREGEALNRIEQFLQMRPAHGPAWNLAGRLSMKLGKMQKAMHAFRHCFTLLDRPKEALADLANLYLRMGQASQAARLLKPMKAEGMWDPRLVLRIARGLADQQDTAGAMEVLQTGQMLSEDPAIFQQPIEELKKTRAKIAFFCGGDGTTFLKGIHHYLSKRHPVRFFEGSSPSEMAELMKWSDISWFEWATNLAHIGSKLPKVCRTIVRLHRYEAYEPWPREIQWHNVDLLITVGNSYVIKALEHWLPDIRQQVSIAKVPNGVDLGTISFQNRPRGKNVAFVASLRMVKNPMLLLQCMKHLHQIDPEYQLFIAGESKELLMDHYFQHQVRVLGLEKIIHFDGWQGDVENWLSDKHYLVVTSVIESQGMGALEAMAAGLKPVIHNFPGSEEIYGNKFLFNTPDEFCRHILSDDYNPCAYREFVEQRYPLSRSLLKINEIMSSFEQNPVTLSARSPVETTGI